MTRLTRDEYGLALAKAASLRADCTRRQVGAVIVSPDGSIVATGMNGRAAGLPGCASAGACPRGQMTYEEQPAGVGYAETACDACHAEANAIIRAGRDRCIGATIYVTDEPCHGCSVLIAAAGLARVVTPFTVEADALCAEVFDVPATVPPPSAATGAATRHIVWPHGRVDALPPVSNGGRTTPPPVRTGWGGVAFETREALIRAVERERGKSVSNGGGSASPAEAEALPVHRTEAGYPRCATCDGGGCPDCTDPA